MIDILHLDDEKPMLVRTKTALLAHTFEIDIRYRDAASEKAFFTAFSDKRPDCILLDIALGDDDYAGITILEKIRKENFTGPIIMFSNIADVDTITRCMACGATDYVSKELGEVELAYRITKCVKEYIISDIQADKEVSFGGHTLRQIQHRIQKIIKSPIKSVMVFGESGTGKEKVAQILQNSLAKNVPFVSFNCGAISEELTESELFGHKKGAFTGAARDRKGLFQKANGGWIFLDEVAELSQSAQVSLLRVLESGELKPVGSDETNEIDVKVITATNENMDRLIDQGKFRADLYQRLKSVEIVLLPVRDRTKEELSEIIDYLIYRLNKQVKDNYVYRLANEAKMLLMAYDWHEGNIREIFQAILASTEDPIPGNNEMIIGVSSLPDYFLKKLNQSKKKGNKDDIPCSDLHDFIKECSDLSFPLSLKEQEQRFTSYLLELMVAKHPDVVRFASRVAINLGVDRSVLYNRLNRLSKSGLLPEAFKNLVN